MVESDCWPGFLNLKEKRHDGISKEIEVNLKFNRDWILKTVEIWEVRKGKKEGERLNE